MQFAFANSFTFQQGLYIQADYFIYRRYYNSAVAYIILSLHVVYSTNKSSGVVFRIRCIRIPVTLFHP